MSGVTAAGLDPAASGGPGSAADRGVAPGRSPRLFGLFQWYARRYVGKHFHAVRLSRSGFRPGPDEGPDGPVIGVVNHPSWWDPLIGLVTIRLWQGRPHYAPMAADGLAKYPFLGRLGFFAIEPGSARGGRAFLRAGGAILADPRAMLWVTAQGHFTDARVRPTKLAGGVGHLAARQRTGFALPMALEYAFWDERTPEAFVRFGPPIPLGAVEPGSDPSPAGWTARLERGLQAAQDALAEETLSRDPSRFDLLLGGAAGVGGVYDAWRRLKAGLRGERFVAEHGRPDAVGVTGTGSRPRAE